MIRLLLAEAHPMLRQRLLALFADPAIADDVAAVDVVADVTTPSSLLAPAGPTSIRGSRGAW